jgi:hypothetical protein
MERKAKSKGIGSKHTNGKGITRSSNVVGDPIYKGKHINEAKRNKHQLQDDGSNADLMMEEVQINQTSNDITTLHHIGNESNQIINRTSVEDTNQPDWEVQVVDLQISLAHVGILCNCQQ